MGIQIQIQNPDVFKQLALKKLTTGLLPALEKAKEVVEAKFQNNPAGWTPFAQATILDRRRKGFGPTPMLYRTGHLQSVAVQEIAVDSPTEGHISTSDQMALLQNNGGGRVPGRSFYSLSDDEKKIIFDAFVTGIKW